MAQYFRSSELTNINFTKTPNKVLIKPLRGHNEVILSDGNKIYIDHRFAHEKHAPTNGTVINCCGKLSPFKMPWETENEIKVGDEAIFSYESVMYCLEENQINGRVIIDENNDPYFILDYEDLFLVRREGVIIPVNGYVLVEPIKEGATDFEILKENYNSNKFGIVRHVGTRNERYFAAGTIRNDIFDFEEELNIGDIVCFDFASDVPVEYNLHQSLNSEYYRMQRKDIHAVFTDEEIRDRISL